MNERIERDSMGELPVPAAAYYGAQTMRAVLNFPISDLRLPRAFIQAMGRIKRSHRLEQLDRQMVDPFIRMIVKPFALLSSHRLLVIEQHRVDDCPRTVGFMRRLDQGFGQTSQQVASIIQMRRRGLTDRGNCAVHHGFAPRPTGDFRSLRRESS